jgi:hypothetical protein
LALLCGLCDELTDNNQPASWHDSPNKTRANQPLGRIGESHSNNVSTLDKTRWQVASITSNVASIFAPGLEEAVADKGCGIQAAQLAKGC